MEQVRIEYFGHSCFRLSGCGQRVVLDPYADGSVPGCPKLRLDAEFVYCSHQHHDHNAAECITLHDGGAPKFALTELETDHDDAGGSKRGKNMIRIFDFGGVRVAHFGDLGRPLTDAETAALQGLDCVLLPVGGYFTIDAAQAAAIAASIRPRMIIPMHYRTEQAGYDVIADIDDALPAFDETLNVVTLTYGGYAILEPAAEDTSVEARCAAFHARGCNCCQSTLCALDACTGLKEETAISLAYGFGAGMLSGNMCGAVTGGMMAIGLACSTGEDPEKEKPEMVKLCETLQARFKDRFGTLLCADIQREHAHDLCDTCIAFGVRTAGEIIQNYKH